MMISDKTTTVVVVVVTIMWVLNIVVGMFQFNGYEASESINGIFTAVIGAVLTLRTLSGKDKDK